MHVWQFAKAPETFDLPCKSWGLHRSRSATQDWSQFMTWARVGKQERVEGRPVLPHLAWTAETKEKGTCQLALTVSALEVALQMRVRRLAEDRPCKEQQRVPEVHPSQTWLQERKEGKESRVEWTSQGGEEMEGS